MPDYDMYQEIILQHYKAPKNFGKMDAPDLAGEESNPNCGDHLTVELRLDPARSKVEEVRFHGDGCAISVASASLLTQRVAGRPLEEVRAISQDDVLKLIGIPLSPVRIKCALTGYAALGRALAARVPAEAASDTGWLRGVASP
jgi:nitrogen fixation protein NifU and related proteins